MAPAARVLCLQRAHIKRGRRHISLCSGNCGFLAIELITASLTPEAIARCCRSLSSSVLGSSKARTRIGFPRCGRQAATVPSSSAPIRDRPQWTRRHNNSDRAGVPLLDLEVTGRLPSAQLQNVPGRSLPAEDLTRRLEAPNKLPGDSSVLGATICVKCPTTAVWTKRPAG